MENKWLMPFYYITSVIFIITFALILLIFHPLQIIGNAISYQAHKNVVDAMLWSMNKVLILSGNVLEIESLAGDLPTDKPMIIVSNHQSLYDIPVIGWVLRKHHPKYIAKDSLKKGIPSISYNINHGGSITIDRNNQRQATRSIIEFCDYLNANNRAGCIFAEGRRAKDGKMLPLKKLGLSIMLKKMPDAIVVPVALDRFWRLEEFKLFPISFGHRMKCTILPPIDRTKFEKDALVEEVERQIRVALNQELVKVSVDLPKEKTV